jgi:aldose 1-epimerase
MAEPNPDTEITLTAHDYQLVVSPYGASLRGLTRQNKPVIAGYHGKAGKVGGQGDVLIPFPGRVTAGKYSFQGQEYQMPLNDSEGPNAIHGFLRTQMWETKEQENDRVTFQTAITPDQHPGYPFSLSVTMTYALSAEGLRVQFSIQNTGKQDAPVAAGCHPYFTVNTPLIDTATLQVPFDSYMEYQNLVPTGKILPVEGTTCDFRQAHTIGAVQFNTCFLGPKRDSDGLIRVILSASDGPDAQSLTVWLDNTFSYVVLYSGDPLPESHRRRALAIEPMTCGSDAFNHPDWGLVTLAPGQTLSGAWGVTAHQGQGA